ncbi:DUF4917 family protein [Serratia marcescens]|uniref:DUF4917 family protein n=1 Tax=Serratia sarumanii TaxID=3020826 RepID=UPI001A1D81F4|nr:DUF4917 family protein [Serratia marcescens]HEJ6937044.1 DUF4917 family protein [Serratia marcescens]HEJ7844619.1 DUF4917 family protein [Serratia marcescens]
MVAIKQWADIEANYDDTLLLGNGASIAVSSDFAYRSLCQKLTELSSDGQLTALFEQFDTQDFELILHRLWIATQVNQQLGVPENATTEGYDLLRNLLIQCVSQNHPEHHEITDVLVKIRAFIGRFKTVLSLNYDLIVYWASLLEDTTTRKLKDCFVYGLFNEQFDWRDFRSLHWKDRANGYNSISLVFYPHGSLILAQNFSGQEFKLHTDSHGEGNYLQQISQHWDSGAVTPVFVSEGTSKQKLSAIVRSRYLDTVYREVLPEKKESIVIYGWSMGENDSHILDALKKSRPSRVAISVYGSDASDCDAVERRLRLAFGQDLIVDFFASESASCWCH